jgi:hypothetical protein
LKLRQRFREQAHRDEEFVTGSVPKRLERDGLAVDNYIDKQIDRAREARYLKE